MNKCRGFTLIDLLITISIVAIVLSFAVPSRNMVLNGRLVTEVNGMVADINLSRSEAVKRTQNVTICKRNAAGTSCNPAAAWEDGWIVFTDNNNDGVFTDDGDATLCELGEECILRLRVPLAAGNTIVFPNNRITFNSRGFAIGFNGSLIFCDTRGAGSARGLVLSNVGRLRTIKDDDDDGVEDGTLLPITCP